MGAILPCDVIADTVHSFSGMGMPLKGDRQVCEGGQGHLSLSPYWPPGLLRSQFLDRDVTMVAEAGVPEHKIKILGRWNSETYQVYMSSELNIS